MQFSVLLPWIIFSPIYHPTLLVCCSCRPLSWKQNLSTFPPWSTQVSYKEQVTDYGRRKFIRREGGKRHTKQHLPLREVKPWLVKYQLRNGLKRSLSISLIGSSKTALGAMSLLVTVSTDGTREPWKETQLQLARRTLGKGASRSRSKRAAPVHLAADTAGRRQRVPADVIQEGTAGGPDPAALGRLWPAAAPRARSPRDTCPV